MELTFNKEGGVYVATFEAVEDFALHIEKPQGSLQMYQSTVANGGFALVRSFGDRWQTGTIDEVVPVLISPIYIRLVSAVEPTMAVVTFGAEVEAALNEVIVSSLNNPV